MLDPGKDEGPPYRVQVILDTLADDEWLGYIRHWRRYSSFQSVVDIRAEHSQGPPVATEMDRVIDVGMESAINQTLENIGAPAALVPPEPPREVPLPK